MDENKLKLLKDKDRLLRYVKTVKDYSEVARSLSISLTDLKRVLKYHGIWEELDHGANTPENDLQKILTGFSKSRKVIPPYEIDFYNPELRLGVEFNGQYWHSNDYKTQYYHQEKAQMAWSNGIRLYQIFEWEWNTEKSRNIIKSHLNRLMEKLPIIETQALTPVSKEDCETFFYLNDFKIPAFEYAIGLRDISGLVAVLAVGKYVSYAEKLDIVVKDGLKILSDEVDETLEARVDLAKYVYPWEYSGFSIQGCTEPEFVWFKNDVLTSEKKEYLLAANKDLSEDEYLRKEGYKKVYDCGLIKMIKTKKSS